MDANRQRFFMLADRKSWTLESSVHYDGTDRVLELASEAQPSFPDSEALARQRVLETPGAIDRFGTRAHWDLDSGEVKATGSGHDPETSIYVPPIGQGVTDLVAVDHVLYLAVSGRIDVKHLTDRFELTSVSLDGFSVWRIAADPQGGGVYALDHTSRRIGRLSGLPLPTRPYAPYAPDVFRPRPENPRPPEITVLAPAIWPADEDAVAIATSPEGRFALLTWTAAGDARLRLLDENDVLGDPIVIDGVQHPRAGEPIVLAGSRHPYSVAWVSESEVAVLLADVGEAVVYTVDPEVDVAVDGPRTVLPSGAFYPLPNHDGGPFLHGPTLPPYFPTTTGAAGLYRISLPGRAALGVASSAAPFDAGSPQAVWHRMYLEASIPAGSGVRVRLAATNDLTPPDPNDDSCWFDHRFGANAGPPRRDGEPTGVWLPQPSELPHHPGLLPCPAERDRTGLFTALVQRSGLRVRSLRGRFLWTRVELHGDGRGTPEIAALRVYSPRFSYVDNYLPALYRESVFAPEANEPSARSTPADFLERFLANFEGILTPLEDRIAASYLLTDPNTTPNDALDWLGSWIGYEFDGAFPDATRRRLLERAPDLYRWRGTLRGLQLALDIVTGGAVQKGAVVLLEDFKLRRTFATILGADLSDADDPLLPGLGVSGNSYVGDSLILGEENMREFLALFSADLQAQAASRKQRLLDARAIATLFDSLAFRVTVLVHQEVEAFDLGLIRKVVDREKPAHVQARVITASHRFLTGMSSLVGIDTFLGPKPPPRGVELGRTVLGAGDFVEQSPSLDPRLDGDVASTPPHADLVANGAVAFGQSFHLDASGSRAAPGHQIVRYIWKRLT
jgi:phage tail-like protein